MDPFHGIHGILCMVGSSSLDLFSSSSCSTHKSPNPTATNVLSKGRMLIVFSHLPNSNKWIEKRLEHWPRSEVKITIFENSPQRFGLKIIIRNLMRKWALKTLIRWHGCCSQACSPWLIYLFLLDDHQARTCVPMRKTNRFFILSFLPITIMMMQKGAVKYSSYCGGAGGVNILLKTSYYKRSQKRPLQSIRTDLSVFNYC